jgi:type IX secretion system PorP/SprF family membrane protein
MKNAFFGFMAVACFCHTLSAQQDPQYTMFYFNKMLYNPAYAGAKDAICATLLGRSQWAGMQGAPNTWLLTADMPVKLTNNDYLGIGITTYGDYIGFQQDHDLKVALAYRRKNLGPGHLAVGVDLGFTNKNLINPNWIPPVPGSLPFDPGIPAVNAPSAFVFDLNAGAYYHSDRFYAGISVMHLTASSFNALNVQQARHMYLTGGYTWSLNGSWRLNPNLLVRTDFVTANFDLNLNALYDINGKHGIFFGSTYRYMDAVGLNVGYNGTYMNGRLGVLVGYNYDINTSRLQSFNSGSHEIILRVCFKTDKSKEIGYPRYIIRFADTLKKRY